MTHRKKTDAKHLAYLAYRLGCLPFILIEGRDWRDALAFLNGKSGKLRPEWISPAQFEWVVAEGCEAINALQTDVEVNGHQRADAARLAIKDQWASLVARDAARRGDVQWMLEAVRLWKQRWRVEQGHQQMKEELGLDHFEGRSWRGFHHHAAMVMLAYGFLLLEQVRPRPEPRRSGKKGAHSRR